jgi:O-antigen ligase
MNVILLTFARSVLITLALTIFLLVLILIRRGKLMGAKFVHLFIALSFSVVLIVALTPKSQLIAVYDRMIYRAFIGADQSVDSRLDGFRVAWNMAKIKNFVGVGIGGSYAYWYREMGGAPTVALVKLPQTVYQRHKIQSLWLEVLAELGAIGIFIFASLGFALCYQALQATRIDPGMDSYVAFVMLVVFFLFTSHWFPNLCRPDIWSWIGIWGASITYGIANDGKGSSSLGDQV